MATQDFAGKSSTLHLRTLTLELGPQRIVDDDGPAIGESFDRMADVRWYDRD